MASPANSRDSHSPRPHDASSTLKRPRRYVSRACDWCRVKRIKCDNGQPCKPCLLRGEECTNKGSDDVPRTLPQALREIERLERRVKELEAEIAARGDFQTSLPTPDQASLVSSTPCTCPQTDSLHAACPTSRASIQTSPKPQWEGIWTATARSDRPSYYGPSSAFYFVSRIASYLARTLEQPHINQSMHLRGASKHMHASAETTHEDGSAMATVGGRAQALGRVQEESLIKLFWESYHCLVPIIDEGDFRRHYASLWEPARQARKQSPLVDILLALCLQFGYAYIPREATHPLDRDSVTGDASVAGRWYYRRAQLLLTVDLESPSLTTVQCYIFMIFYLCCASFQNMCHIVTAQAIRTAHVLGLHLEPPADMPRHEREHRKRIWWALWMLEIKISIKYGRPFMIDGATVTASLPSDDFELATGPGASLGAYTHDVNWLSYSVHQSKLWLATAGTYETFFEKSGELISQTSDSSLYTNPEVLEACAKFLATKFPAIRAWVDDVPDQLKLKRRGGGESFSPYRSTIDMDLLAPTWLQRQRVCLELSYHSIITNLTRPFITFYSHPNTYTPVAERFASICIDHAVAFIFITHQTAAELDIMNGWSEHFTLLWNTAITAMGFVLANPIHQSTPKAREALDKAVELFDKFGQHFVVSADAAKIMRNMMANVDRLASGQVASTGLVDGISTTTTGVPEGDSTAGLDELAWLDPNQQGGDAYFTQFMDWAMSVDTYSSFDNFFDINNTMSAHAG
ncbi:hypothetical protein S40285_03134 [Stachybotrys chlorohalonatus IBT 40285]|uniref:Zn(2)-C6 fungal-type domain-containing protein n=1 Tax=Stachybotrys chlorohalonatus (strain IBT 40285) TaxID=1283841 RepID=A0A084QM78_STAC4|nr:hypothetical protein S40285_03134 [Stachybotrys chlorohalonata IBT 40285]